MPATTTLLLDGFWAAPGATAACVVRCRPPTVERKSSITTAAAWCCWNACPTIHRRRPPPQRTDQCGCLQHGRPDRSCGPAFGTDAADSASSLHERSAFGHAGGPFDSTARRSPDAAGQRVPQATDAAPWDIPTLAIWCPGDLIVVPGSSARWARANQIIRCTVPGHAWRFTPHRCAGQLSHFSKKKMFLQTSRHKHPELSTVPRRDFLFPRSLTEMPLCPPGWSHS